jgi:hypothetical protein
LNWITEWLRLGIISTCARSKSAYTAFAFAIVKLFRVSAVAKLFSRAFDRGGEISAVPGARS